MSAVDFDQAGFADWLNEYSGRSGSIVVTPIKGGGSCEMFELQQGGERFVIRRAPLTAVSETAHNVVREFRIIETLSDGAVRVPRVFLCCEDPAILGAPFYVMDFIDGEVIRRRLPPSYLDVSESHTHIGEELMDALIELHAFEWRGTALESMAKPDNFLARQVSRWMSQLDSYRDRELAGVDAVARWLDDNRPRAGDLTVMHGDYKVDNAMYSRTLPPRILSIVDFEMTTVGDPLIDLAWAMIFWPEEGNHIAIAAPGSEGGMHADYCQSPAMLVNRYAERTGRDMTHMQWYHAFAAWKLAIVLEASYAKFRSGASQNPNHEFFGFLVDQLMQRAQVFAR